MKGLPTVEKGERRKFCIDTIQIKRGGEMRFIEVGGRLLQIYKDKFWKSGWDSFEDYVADMQMSTATAYKLIKIYEKFILEYNFSHLQLAEAGGWTVISEILPVVNNRDDAEEWIGRCETLSRSDLRRTIHETAHNTDMAACKHDDTYTLICCRECGIRMKDLQAT